MVLEETRIHPPVTVTTEEARVETQIQIPIVTWVGLPGDYLGRIVNTRGESSLGSSQTYGGGPRNPEREIQQNDIP
jgi:hypothetical protein